MRTSISPEGSVSVAIAAPPSRVFASLANGDSAATWMSQGSIVTSSRHGPFVAGDSVRVQTRSILRMPQQQIVWRVTEVVPDRILAWQFISSHDSRMIAIRRDSLVASGDSTIVVSRVVSPPIDSIRKAQAAAKDTENAAFNRMATELLLNMIRMQPKIDLMRLKARIEKR